MWILKRKKKLNMNPACSVSLGVYEWRRRGFVYFTNTEAHMNLRWFRPLQSHYLTTWTHEHLQAVRVTSWEFYHFIWEKPASNHTVYTENFTATCQIKVWFTHVREYITLYYFCTVDVPFIYSIYCPNLNKTNDKNNYYNYINHINVEKLLKLF